MVRGAYRVVRRRHCQCRRFAVNHDDMKRIHVVPGHRTSGSRAPRKHSTRRESLRLGLTIGVMTWLWVAGFDYFRGEPFHTFDFLGGIMRFTLVHFALCIAYGFAIITAVHSSMKESTVIFGIILLAILFQFAAIVVTTMLSNIGIGEFAWGTFLVGNLIATGVTVALISRDHSLRDVFHAAEALQKN